MVHLRVDVDHVQTTTNRRDEIDVITCSLWGWRLPQHVPGSYPVAPVGYRSGVSSTHEPRLDIAIHTYHHMDRHYSSHPPGILRFRFYTHQLCIWVALLHIAYAWPCCSLAPDQDLICVSMVRVFRTEDGTGTKQRESITDTDIQPCQKRSTTISTGVLGGLCGIHCSVFP